MELKTKIFEENFEEHLRNHDKFVLNIDFKNLKTMTKYFPLYSPNQITKRFNFLPFQTNDPFLYPLKISEKLWFPDIFRRYGKGIWN